MELIIGYRLTAAAAAVVVVVVDVLLLLPTATNCVLLISSDELYDTLQEANEDEKFITFCWWVFGFDDMFVWKLCTCVCVGCSRGIGESSSILLVGKASKRTMKNGSFDSIWESGGSLLAVGKHTSHDCSLNGVNLLPKWKLFRSNS